MTGKLVRYLPTFVFGLVVAASLAEPTFAQQREDFLRLRLPVLYTTNPDDFWGALRTIINFVLLLGGLIAFLYVLWGGFIYLTAGGDNNKADGGRKIIVNAIIGVIIIFISFALVNFLINRIPAGGGGRDSGIYT